MKQIAWIAALLCLLCGCAAKYETEEVFLLHDVPVPVDAPAPRYEMFCQVPDAAVQAFAGEDGVVYEANSGDFFLSSRTLPGMDAAKAMRAITGMEPEALDPVELESMGMRDYRFTWWAQTEDGLWLCRGRVLEDTDCCYALCAACCPEDPDARSACDRALETFSLNSARDAMP